MAIFGWQQWSDLRPSFPSISWFAVVKSMMRFSTTYCYITLLFTQFLNKLHSSSKLQWLRTPPPPGCYSKVVSKIQRHLEKFTVFMSRDHESEVRIQDWTGKMLPRLLTQVHRGTHSLVITPAPLLQAQILTVVCDIDHAAERARGDDRW